MGSRNGDYSSSWGMLRVLNELPVNPPLKETFMEQNHEVGTIWVKIMIKQQDSKYSCLSSIDLMVARGYMSDIINLDQ